MTYFLRMSSWIIMDILLVCWLQLLFGFAQLFQHIIRDRLVAGPEHIDPFLPLLDIVFV